MLRPCSRSWIALACALLALALASCGTAAPPTSSAPPAQTAAAPAQKPLKVAFFGFAAANGFAQGTWSGVQKAAKEAGVETTFFDPNFDSSKQIAQIQDAITAGEYQVFVIQANDGNAVVPVIKQALAAGITVVGEFTPIGTDYSSIEPQVPGMIYVGTSITRNGEGLGELGIKACEGLSTCNVAYLEGFKSLPLDNARTKAVIDKLKTASNVNVVASVEGGYTKDSGLKAAQDLLQAHPDINVIIGSSQAILGSVQAVKDAGKESQIKLIGNGAPRQVITALRAGQVYAIWGDLEADAGAKATEIGIKAARGEKVPVSFNTETLFPTPLLTKDNLPADFVGQWDA